jgi:hypothetical protein
MTRIYFDTEFIEDGKTIDLISIGMVTDQVHDNELYLVSSEFDESKADLWVQTNVLSKIPAGFPRRSRTEIAAAVSDYVFRASNGITPQMWAYYGASDWGALYQLFGRLLDLPAWFPKYVMDLKQLLVSIGNPPLVKQPAGQEHNALYDARRVRDTYQYFRGARP